MTAVVAGAMTAGVGAASVVAVPERAVATDVDLAASITIKIFDFDTPGPISISRLLTLTLNALPNNLSAILNSEAGTVYDLPGLYTNFSSAGQQTFSATRDPGESIGFGFTSLGPQDGVWDVLNGFATGDTHVDQGRTFGLDLLTGGSQGIGARLSGVLSQASVDRELTLLDSGITSNYDRTVGVFGGELSFTPFDGSKAVGNFTAIDGGGTRGFKLGSLEVDTFSTGSLGGDAGLCLGSAQASCDGNTSFLSVGAPVTGGLSVNGTNIISGDFSTNKIVSTLKDGQFSVTGAIGGTVTVGSISIGQPIPIDIQIPRTSSLMSSSSSKQQQSVRDSFIAVPRKSASDNETGGRHRAPLRDAVNATIDNVKAAVANATQPKHAKAESED